ncbi:MAG: hypothetical protein M0002_02775 [Rhodospirillales bacterium]|nr:hypothetical protein [Rhodospirillales bacterium]
MSEVLRALAEREGRSELEVLEDVQTAAADLIRVRALGRDAEGGTLPLDQGVAFVERSRDMVLAAACAAIEKRPFFGRNKAQRAMDYLSHVRIGQTERGSFVLRILSPVAPELRPLQPELLQIEDDGRIEADEPYERQVTRTLMEALGALDEATRRAVSDLDMKAFQAAVGRGVSANFCEAVAGLSAAGAREGLEVQVSWSRARPVDGKAPGRMAPARVRLGSDSIPIIEEAARLFRETAGLDDFEVQGVVTRLDRGPAATEGDVTITGDVEGQMRRVVLRLGPETYRQATRAHESRRTVRCTGELVREGRGYRLQSPRHFEVLTSEEAG